MQTEQNMAPPAPVENRIGAALALRLGAIFGALAVGLGAFAAHAMKARFAAEQLHTFEVGVRYQMYHALALCLCALLQRNGFRTRAATWLFAVGIVLFSGSLYGLVLLDVPKLLGPITPIGGTALIAGWIALAWGSRRARA